MQLFVHVVQICLDIVNGVEIASTSLKPEYVPQITSYALPENIAWLTWI